MSTVFENAATPARDYSEVARQPLEADRCALIVVDIQQKLLPPIFQKDQLVRNAKLLIRAAGIPQDSAVVSTQYAKGLGGDRSGDRFPAARNRGYRQESFLLLRQ